MHAEQTKPAAAPEQSAQATLNEQIAAPEQTSAPQPTVILDEEFKIILPALDKDIFASLEDNILEHGCRDALVIWNGILIDGYNRYSICTKHGIPFNVISKDFDNREQVLIWIIKNQVSRRNLTEIQLSYYRGLHYITDKILKGTYKRKKASDDHMCQNDTYGITRDKLAEKYHVSPRTIIRDSKVAEAINAIGEESPEAKRKILAGETKLEKKSLNEIAAGGKEDLKTTVEQIVNGTYKKKPRQASVTTSGNEADANNGSTTDYDSSVAEPSGSRYWNAAILKVADEYTTVLRNPEPHTSTTYLKETLKAFISALESIQMKM